jgi:hypothetical protein
MRPGLTTPGRFSATAPRCVRTGLPFSGALNPATYVFGASRERDVFRPAAAEIGSVHILKIMESARTLICQHTGRGLRDVTTV